MRTIVILLLLVNTVYAQPKKSKKKQILNKELILKREIANCKIGTQKAQTDFYNEIYVLQTLGQLVDKDFHPFFIKTAKEKHNIKLTAAPCDVFTEQKCYDKTMREKVLTKFGNDIEDKIKREALSEFKQSEVYKKDIQPKIDTGFVFTDVHTKTKFPGDETEIRKFIKTNIQEIKNSSYWSANISFIVEKDGSLSNTTFIKEPKEEIKNEVIRIVQLMPKWIPAQYYGENVRSRQTIGISSKQNMEMMESIQAKKTKSAN